MSEEAAVVEQDKSKVLEEIVSEDKRISDELAAVMQQMVVASGTVFFTEVPRVKYMTRPAPTPDGYVAVMLRAFRYGYFLVEKNPECKGCGGDGLDKRTDASTKLSEIPYCPACVHTEIQHFGRVWEAKLADKAAVEEAEERAERTDKKLEKRLAGARARVEELEQGKSDALGQNKLDVEATKAEIEKLTAFAARLKADEEQNDQHLRQAMKIYDKSAADAREHCEQKIREANAVLQSELAEIKKSRDQYMQDHGRIVETASTATTTNLRMRRDAEEALARYEAGPAKIAKRWDEKIEPAKRTLERLERQYKA